MKNYFALVAIATLVISISSCKEDDPKPSTDLTPSVVGTYTGTLTFGTDVFTDEPITVSKQSNLRIHIQPSDDPATFYAILAEQTDGLTLTVPSQVTTGNGIPGGSVTINGNGFYQTSDNTMHYTLVLNFANGTSINSEFLGTKQ